MVVSYPTRRVTRGSDQSGTERDAPLVETLRVRDRSGLKPSGPRRGLRHTAAGARLHTVTTSGAAVAFVVTSDAISTTSGP